MSGLAALASAVAGLTIGAVLTALGLYAALLISDRFNGPRPS